MSIGLLKGNRLSELKKGDIIQCNEALSEFEKISYSIETPVGQSSSKEVKVMRVARHNDEVYITVLSDKGRLYCESFSVFSELKSLAMKFGFKQAVVIPF